jgi:hypothetical protein
MTTLTNWLSPSAMHSLSWTLLHVLWQGTAVGALALTLSASVTPCRVVPVAALPETDGTPAMIQLEAMPALLQQPTTDQRTVQHVLHSAAMPSLTVTVSSDLTYLGRLNYDVQDVGQAEEYIFADTADGKLQRAFIAHFEHFLPGNEHVFNYPRLRMAMLGQHEYLHQTWAIREFDLFEIPAMKEFLRSRNLRAEASWLVDRYVRAVDEKRKNEVIFFYLEAASANPSDIHYGGAPSEPPPPPAPPPAVEREFLRRASAAFQVSEP